MQRDLGLRSCARMAAGQTLEWAHRKEIRQTEDYARWFGSLRDRQARVRVDSRIRRLSLGNPGDVRPVGEGVSEIRIDHGPGYRVYLVQRSKALFVPLAGGDKDSQKRDILRALELARGL